MYVPIFVSSRRVREERGSTMLMVLAGMLTFFGVSGLALDTGQIFLDKSRLSRAVDAGALAAARVLRQGQELAQQQAVAVAAANGVVHGANGDSLRVAFGTGSVGEPTVTVTASRATRMNFLSVLGADQVTLRSQATAAVNPLDLVLVLDQSSSLVTNGGWPFLQPAARDFVKRFSDTYDKLGLVSFYVKAVAHQPLQQPFTANLEASIAGLQPLLGTNTGDALKLALDEMQSSRVRPNTLRVVVLFTDGNPTSLSGGFGSTGAPRYVVLNNSSWRGYWEAATLASGDAPKSDATPEGCAYVPSLYKCGGTTFAEAKERATTEPLEWARQLRALGVYVYAIGFGDPASSDAPDVSYLRRLANVGGSENASQPRGEVYFTPSATDLDGIFQRLAQDLAVRLSQ